MPKKPEKKAKNVKKVRRTKSQEKLPEVPSDIAVSSETVKYIYDSMVRIESKIDTVITSNKNKINRGEAYLTTGIVSSCMLFLSLVVNGHILPEDIPMWFKAIID